jgi:anti-anti-sigma factor
VALAIAPLQDLLNLGREGRKNLPGCVAGNWRWWCTNEVLAGKLFARLRDLTGNSKRLASIETVSAGEGTAGQRLPQQTRTGVADAGNGMKSALFRRWRRKAAVEDTRLNVGEIALQVTSAGNLITVKVAGRSTVDSSPHLRSVLLRLVRQGTVPVVVDLSALSYLDMSGIATLLEALRAANDRSVKLRLAGMSGQVRKLAEIAQLDTIFRAWGSEVEFR